MGQKNAQCRFRASNEVISFFENISLFGKKNGSYKSIIYPSKLEACQLMLDHARNQTQGL